FFFFQAEDGIRDDLVTGVQTCALPILINTQEEIKAHCMKLQFSSIMQCALVSSCVLIISQHSSIVLAQGTSTPTYFLFLIPYVRSEERRVGKECRARGSRTH